MCTKQTCSELYLQRQQTVLVMLTVFQCSDARLTGLVSQTATHMALRALQLRALQCFLKCSNCLRPYESGQTPTDARCCNCKTAPFFVVHSPKTAGATSNTHWTTLAAILSPCFGGKLFTIACNSEGRECSCSRLGRIHKQHSSCVSTRHTHTHTNPHNTCHPTQISHPCALEA